MAQHADPPELLPRAPSRRQAAPEEPVEVRRYIDAIRRARWLIAAIMVLLTGVVVGVSVSVPSRYEATASIVKQVNTSRLRERGRRRRHARAGDDRPADH